MERAAGYLDEVALGWTRSRKCGTCHTNYAYMLARPSIGGQGSSDAMKEIRGFFESRVGHWDDPEKDARPRFDAEVIATAAALAINDARTSGKLHPTTRGRSDRIWTLQREDGGFNWLKCDWPPYEHDDYYGAVFAALGVGLAPEGYAKAETAAAGVAKLTRYLHEHPAPDLHHRTFLLWASRKLDGLMTPEEQESTRRALRSLQRADGGWSLPTLGEWKRRDGSPNPKDGPSDGYATGLVVYVLRQAGVPRTTRRSSKAWPGCEGIRGSRGDGSPVRSAMTSATISPTRARGSPSWRWRPVRDGSGSCRPGVPPDHDGRAYRGGIHRMRRKLGISLVVVLLFALGRVWA